MHLIRSIDGFIEDIENGRTYMYDEGLPDYETGKTEVTLTVRNWYQENHIDLAYNEEALRFWKYLETLLKFDITTTADPQPAPVETPRKFKVGDHVVVTRKVIEDDWFWLGRSGRVLNTDGDNGYQVDFDGQSAAMLEEQLTIYDDTVPF